jgi:sugar lactone lactonase YvrE
MGENPAHSIPLGVEQPALQSSINGPTALAIYCHYLYVLEFITDKVWRINLETQTIVLYAGNGKPCCHKDGIRATEASLDSPTSLAVDSNGNLFIGEFSGLVRRVDMSTGTISTVAGDGNVGETLDGTAALSAHFRAVDGLAIDSSNNLFVADKQQGKIFKIDAQTRIIEAFAGNGKQGFQGDGNVAKAATFRLDGGIAFDKNDNLVIADYENCRIRVIENRTRTIVTVAVVGPVIENGSCANASFEPGPYPSDTAVDSIGNIYFVEGAADIVGRESASTLILSTLAGREWERGFSGDGGPAIEARLANPSGLAVDAEGNVYISEFVNNRIRRVDGKTHRISTIAGNGLPHRTDVSY